MPSSSSEPKIPTHIGSTRTQMGILFGFVAIFLVIGASYSIIWRMYNKREERQEAERKQALLDRGFGPLGGVKKVETGGGDGMESACDFDYERFPLKYHCSILDDVLANQRQHKGLPRELTLSKPFSAYTIRMAEAPPDESADIAQQLEDATLHKNVTSSKKNAALLKENMAWSSCTPSEFEESKDCCPELQALAAPKAGHMITLSTMNIWEHDADDVAAKALTNYETFSQNSLSEIPPGAQSITPLREVTTRESRLLMRAKPWPIVARMRQNVEEQRWRSRLGKLAVTFWPRKKALGTDLENKEELEREIGSLDFRELDKIGREERERKAAFTQRLTMGLSGGIWLIAPMLIMVLHPTRNVSLITNP
ncbi:uncharacterized protein PAC_08404 [Phialocephala subalpina]|uniref:Uncharacterized protein n=1 Tax=Phialocephala subalpina TaxID=576137 RepID=A0A1L7X0G5_9HELO|nr:uncharacterized protein PAC_08404 [Phialocephala subalpina]